MKLFIYSFTSTLCFISTFLLAQPNMIYNDFPDANNSSFWENAAFNNQFVFTYTGSEDYKDDIWISDGSTTTNLSENINNANFRMPKATSNQLYFIEDITEETSTLWKSDGTLNGHQAVWENAPKINYMTVFNDQLVFLNHSTNNSNFSLWITDGTTRTLLLDEQNYTSSFAIFNNELYFFTKTHGLMKTDGTTNGTTIVKPYHVDDFRLTNLSTTAIKNGELYFTGCDNQTGCEVWKTDGTEAGTVLVNDLNPAGSSNPSLLLANDKIYAYNQRELFLIDGQNVTPLLDLNEGELRGIMSSGRVINNRVIFNVDTPNKYGLELWTTDGTVAGTKILKDINKSARSSITYWNKSFEPINGFIYFAANDGLFGRELWRTDGTTEGTEIVYDLSPLGASSWLYNIHSVNNQLFFTRRTQSIDAMSINTELWSFDLDNFTPQTPSNYQDDNEWLQSIGVGYRSRLSDFETDKNDNAYIAIINKYSTSFGSVFFDADTIIPFTETGNGRVLVGKFDVTGEFQWAKTIHTNIWEYRQSILMEVDNNGNLFVAGIFDNQLKISGTTINQSNENLFIAKYSADGTFLWVKTGKVDDDYEVKQMLINDNNDIFIGGIFSNIDFQGMTNTGNYFPFIMKLDNNGNHQWFNKIGANVTRVDIAFTPNQDIIATASGMGVYVRKLSSNGNMIWDKTFPNNGWVKADGIAVNRLGDIFIVGSYKDGLRFGAFSADFSSYTNNHNAYLLMLNSLGEIQNMVADETTVSTYHDVQFDDDNNYYLLSKKQLTASTYYENWENYASRKFTTIEKFDQNGQLLQARDLLTYITPDSPTPEIKLDNNGGIFLADMYINQLDSFSNCVPNSNYYQDIAYILHFSLSEKMDKFEVSYPNEDFTILPNPVRDVCKVQVHSDNWKTYTLLIYNSNGQLLRTIQKTDDFSNQQIRVADLPTGVLIFQFDNGQEKVSRKVLKY